LINNKYRNQMITFKVPSDETPTLDSVFNALEIIPIESSVDLIEIILNEGEEYKSTMKLGHSRETDLGLGLLINQRVLDTHKLVIKGNNSTLLCGVRILNGCSITFNDLNFRNKSRSNCGFGVFCQSTQSIFNNCQISNSSKIGLWCYLNSQVQITNTVIKDNKDTGVAVYFATFHAKSSSIDKNGNHGIICSGKGARCILDECNISKHKTAGIFCVEKATMDINGGTISQNNDGISADSGATINVSAMTRVFANECNLYQDEANINVTKEDEQETKIEETIKDETKENK
jgi:hypothetical protein